jgi:hypothetical protein
MRTKMTVLRARKMTIKEAESYAGMKVRMPELREELEEINRLMHNNKCVYVLLVESMKEEDRVALQAAWDKGISQRVILRALRSEGYKTSNEAMLNHRTGNCKCTKND